MGLNALPAGEPPRTLVVIRGNSGSGKTAVARAVRAAYGRGAALIEQDYLRRVILREHDETASTGIAPEFIAQAAGFAVANGYHVILEGILHSGRYGDALRRLITVHSGPSYVYYLDVSLAETLRRHAGRAQAAEFGPEFLRDWYVHRDLLGTPGEVIVDESSSLDETVAQVLRTSGLLDAPAVSYCPTACPRCRAEQDGAAIGRAHPGPARPGDEGTLAAAGPGAVPVRRDA